MKKQKFNLFTKPIIGITVFLGLVFFSLILSSAAAKKTDTFKIKDIIIRESSNTAEARWQLAQNSKSIPGIDISYLKGRNIFSVNLEDEVARVAEVNPSCKEIRLIRVLPNRIVMDYTRRKPLAYVKLYRNFYVDEEAVLFEIPALESQLDMPLISGVESKNYGSKTGRKYDVRQLSVAVNIVKEIKRNDALRGLQVKKVDVSDLGNTSILICNFFQGPGGVKTQQVTVNDMLEVKIGQGYINDKINILYSLFVQEKNNWPNIKYIDLRFKEPVIKFKEIEKKDGASNRSAVNG